MNAEEVFSAMEGRKLPLGESISVVTICVDNDSLSQFKALIESVRMISLRAELSHYQGGHDGSMLLDVLQSIKPDICVIDFDKDREQATATAEMIHEVLGNIAIFAVSENSQPELIIRAMRCGCTEYLLKPIESDELLEALARVGGRKKGTPDLKTAKVLTLLGAKGGCGVTTLSISLAALLRSDYDQNTLLIDYHPDLGDAALFLSLDKYQYNFFDLSENTHRLDPELLQGFLVRHASGLNVLPAPENFGGVDRYVTAEAVGMAMDFLRTQYNFVVVDCPPGLNEANLAMVRQSDQLYLLATPEVPAVRNLARYLEQLNRLDFPADRIHVVINRHSKRDSVAVDQIEKAIRKKIDWKIPNQYAEVVKAINLGEAGRLGGNSEVMRSISTWAESLVGKQKESTSKKRKKGFLGLGL